jgi:hypothetical protein
MKNMIINVLTLLVGIFIGGFVNMGIIMISGWLIPPPEGAIFTTEEGLKAAMQLMEPKHFIMPFLAHALGTFTGALIPAFFAASHKKYFAYSIAMLFFFGGCYMVMILSSPLWFNVTDLALAYFPMAFLALKIASSPKTSVLN